MWISAYKPSALFTLLAMLLSGDGSHHVRKSRSKLVELPSNLVSDEAFDPTNKKVLHHSTQKWVKRWVLYHINPFIFFSVLKIKVGPNRVIWRKDLEEAEVPVYFTPRVEALVDIFYGAKTCGKYSVKESSKYFIAPEELESMESM